MSEPPTSQGDDSVAATAHLARLARHRRLHGPPRFVDYRDAERLVEKLAAEIASAVPPAELAGFRFAAVPRGGLIVLGLLGYALDLAPDRMAGAGEERPTVLVDDCALGGTRLRGALAELAAREVVVAHLLSTPALRRAVVAAESRVRACLAAEDLADRTAELLPDPKERSTWRRRWQERLGGGPYRFGVVEPIAFAWGQPDVVFWDDRGERVGGGWHLVPPERSFKRRMALAGPLAGPPPRRWRVPDTVVHAEEGDRLWLFDAERDTAYSLTGVGADAWRLLAAVGDLDFAIERLATLYEVEDDELRGDLESLLGELEERRLLVQVAGRHGGASSR
jgi:hypothetical protein